jgi:hypothetical protein
MMHAACRLPMSRVKTALAFPSMMTNVAALSRPYLKTPIATKRSTSTMGSSTTPTLVRLLKHEETILKLGVFPPVGTVTWFEGDSNKAFERIQERMNKVIEKNPWLQGNFVKTDGHYHISYTDDMDALSNINENGMLVPVQSEDSKVSYGMPYMELPQAGSDYLLKKNKDLDQPFWKVAIVPCASSPNARFAVFISVSHVLGDGHTFYDLHNMLLGSTWGDGSSAADIRSLRIERLYDTKNHQEKQMGSKEAYIGSSMGYMACALRGVASEALGLSKVSNRVFLIDNDKMNEIKKSEKGPQDFVSTNDAVTSWFLTNAKCKHGWMAVNFRGKLEGHDDDLVGNYENAITYKCPEDTSTPADIRASLKSLKRVVTTDTKVSDWAFASGDLGLATNWASFAGSANLPGCKELVHIPCGPTLPPTIPTCIIFKARPGKLGVVLLGTKEVTEMRAPFESDEELYQM